MSLPSTTLAIDFGSKYIGLTLVEHPHAKENRILYAATVVVDPKPLKALSETRAAVRRLRRTRKTHDRRLRRLAEALAGISNAALILQFCRRRGFAHDAPEEQDAQSFHISREGFFTALEERVNQVIPESDRARVLAACERHLNKSRWLGAELRPARFENRGRSRCNWEGCRHNVPRAGNDVEGRLRQSLFLWLCPVFENSADPQRLRKSVEHWITELAALGTAYRGVEGRFSSPDEAKQARTPINRRIAKVYQNLRSRVAREASAEVAESFETNWTEYYRKIVSETIRGETGGRVQFCRTHSTQFIDHVLAGRPIPIKLEITERDLIARTQQIVFRRLWRLVAGRILPLAGHRIDRVVVERVAFDVLSGPLKARQDLSEDKASEIYWHGPQAGFVSRAEMLAAEFGGRRAYCGEPNETTEVEHLLHRGDFPFDSYFNVVPACRQCNARKGGRTALEVNMTIHDAAFEAYSDYLRKIRVLHPYHTIKKGILNLLRRPATVERAQQMVAMIADNLVTISNTQRSPRPLARYLATHLERCTGTRPRIDYRAGRHTALYRDVVLPQYDKSQAKLDEDLRNHAVDAIILGCDLPSAAALENRRWTTTSGDVIRWMNEVRAAAPETVDGLPTVQPVRFVPHFENDAGGNYCVIDLSAFNWNRERKAAHKLDPFGKTKSGIPVKRVPAMDVLVALRAGPVARDKQIKMIAHRTLRKLLTESRDDAPTALIRWLQQTTKAGLDGDSMSPHPADRERGRLLDVFVNSSPADFLAQDNPLTIPWVIGVRCLNADTGSRRKVNVGRAVNGNNAAQFYQSESMVKEIHVGYRLVDGQIDRQHPVVFAVSQIDAVSRRVGGRWETVDFPAGSPLIGRTFGTGDSVKEFRERWSAAFADLCRSEEIVKSFKITQGCVIEKLDGTRFQFRNFDSSQPWMKNAPFANIRRVFRTPFNAMGPE